MSTTRTIASGWRFSQVGGGQGTGNGEWLPVSTFPTTVHVELLRSNRIPDPFLGLNEWEVQWIGETDWVFQNTFTVTEEDLVASNADLVFEGLDTFASITLNGQHILNTQSQFIAYRAAVKPHLKVGPNDLLITFASAFKKGRVLEKANGKFHLWNGDSSRLHVRKAQYNYGWDWGPILMTVGPWKPISLHTYDVYLSDVDIRSDVSEALDVKISVDFSLSHEFSGLASITLYDPEGDIVHTEKNIKIEFTNGHSEFKFSSGELQLWYPIRYGKQPLYSLIVSVSDTAGKVVDSKTERIAFRRVRVVQEPLIDQPGKTFLFEVNNIRIFCGGSNWIPADSFLTTVTTERYRAWLQLLIDGNQNMIRVWGGGIYEADPFYDICDELGILVWQDFMFGCGQVCSLGISSYLETDVGLVPSL